MDNFDASLSKLVCAVMPVAFCRCDLDVPLDPKKLVLAPTEGSCVCTASTGNIIGVPSQSGSSTFIPKGNVTSFNSNNVLIFNPYALAILLGVSSDNDVMCPMSCVAASPTTCTERERFRRLRRGSCEDDDARGDKSLPRDTMGPCETSGDRGEGEMGGIICRNGVIG